MSEGPYEQGGQERRIVGADDVRVVSVTPDVEARGNAADGEFPPNKTYWLFRHVTLQNFFKIQLDPPPRKPVTPKSLCWASISEADGQGNPFIGAANVELYSVAPAYRTIWVSGRVWFDRPLIVLIRVLWINLDV